MAVINLKSNILVVTYWSFKEGLIQSYTLPYIKMLSKRIPADARIYLITFEKEGMKFSDSEWTDIKADLAKDHIVPMPFDYFRFGLQAILNAVKSVFSLISFVRSNNIQVIHAWCTPAGALAYILSVFSRTPLVLDSFEPHAEAMVENGTWKRTSLPYRLLFWLEGKMAKRSTAVIGCASGMKDYAKSRFNIELEEFVVKPACTDLDLFDPYLPKDPKLVEKLKLKDCIVCVYAGKLGGIYYDKELFDFFKVASDYWSGKFKVLLLTSNSSEEVNKYITQSGLDPDIIFHSFVHFNEISNYMRLADFGITPVKPVPTKLYCTPIKDGEYWALGLPVVITPKISDDSDIIEKHKIGVILKGTDYTSNLEAIRELDILLKSDRKELKDRIVKVAAKYRHYNIAEKAYDFVYGEKSDRLK